MLLQELRRYRALSPDEKELMQRATAGLGPKHGIWRWSAKEDRQIMAFMRTRATTGLPRPYQPDDSVRELAAQLGRTYEAVHKRIQRLRKRSKCPRAGQRAKG